MGMPLADAFRGYLASADSPSLGRDLHIGDLDRNILQPISHMGTNVTVVAGVALSFKIRGQDRVAMTWIGDGATKTAACHEGLTLAAARGVPAVFVIQNNQVALGTRATTHGHGDLRSWGRAYGIESLSCDGNNVLDVHAAASLAVTRCRRGEGPVILVAETFRMGGHATHDEREARETFPPELFRRWGRRDPIALMEQFLLSEGVDRTTLEGIEGEVTSEVDTAGEVARRSKDRSPTPEGAIYPGFSEGFPLIGLQKRPTGAQWSNE
jgi:TPP-dependent pyruvate/acetoin dehydrogenase alpha subunit